MHTHMHMRTCTCTMHNAHMHVHAYQVAIEKHLAEGRHRTRVLKALLGIAHALNRDLILPRMLCYCDFMWKEMKACMPD